MDKPKMQNSINALKEAIADEIYDLNVHLSRICKERFDLENKVETLEREIEVSNNRKDSLNKVLRNLDKIEKGETIYEEDI